MLKNLQHKFFTTHSHVPSQPLWTVFKGEYLVMLFIHFR